jgi:hypothetical protein
MSKEGTNEKKKERRRMKGGHLWKNLSDGRY